MEKIDQNYLYQESVLIKQKIKPTKLEKIQWQYIRRFCFNKKKSIKTLLSLIFLITLIEILIPVIFKYFFDRFSYSLEVLNLYYTFGILFFILVSYIILNYFAIRLQKQIALDFINRLREDWIKIYFSKNIFSLSDRDKGSALVKISYHFSLLIMGLNNSFFIFFQWLLYTIGILIVTFFVSSKLFLMSLAFFPINLIIIFFSYIVSSHYLSQDQTLYTKILQKISDSFNSFFFIKMLDKENVLLSDLRKMVDVDTYFRVHREITLNIGNRIIFVLITFISGGLYIYNLYFPLLSFEGGIISLVYAIVIILQIRLLYLSLNVGLYFFPLKLGAILCIPDKNITSQNRQILDKNINTISFISKKVKLDGKNYLHNISFDFKKGGKYLISGPVGSGKSMILSIISGHTKLFYGLPWTIRLNERRILYKKWHEDHPKTFLISPYFQSEAPIYDFIKNYETIEEYQDIPAFSFLFSNGKFLGQSITKGKNSLVDICVLQILYCIIESPQIVTVDNIWIDLNHPHINEAMSIMFSKLKNSIIVCGSSSENNLHLYDSVFKI